MNHEESSSSHGHREEKILSTGILNTVVGQAQAHLEIVNLSFRPRTVRFQIINWNSGIPVVTNDQTVTIPPNQFRTFNNPVTPFHYELRVQHPGSSNLIVNHFAADATTATIAGLTFLQNDLIEINRPLI